MSVWAVVVTYNRRDLLRECLNALRSQSRPPDHVLVVDNASTDGTPELVRSEFGEVELLTLPENAGGAGGFHVGLERAYEEGAEWMWLMDDDTIARPDALDTLLAAPARLQGSAAPLLLGSRVVWTNGELHPMNYPSFKREPPEQFIEATRRGLLPLRMATFVSLLVHRDAVEGFGLPLAHYFIWSDDIEYTARVLRTGPFGYLVPDSTVEHRTKSAHTAVTDTGGRFYFHVRNSVYMLRSSAWSLREKASLVWMLYATTHAYLRRNRFGRQSVALVARAMRDGVRPVPAAP